MKSIRLDKIDQIQGERLSEDSTFNFRCYPGISCFNQCCRNLNLFLYPYDVIRLKSALGITSDEFLEKYVDLVLRDGNFFPDALLHMAEDREMACPFLSSSGCTVYADRPGTCRNFPVERGMLFDEATKSMQLIHFYRPPDFCMGRYEKKTWTPKTWEKDQEAEDYHYMTVQWATLKGLFQNNPWQDEGPEGKRAKMAFMATYNMDRFRTFIFESSFLDRYKLKPALIKKIKKSDTELLKLGFEWVKFFLWSIPPENIRPKYSKKR